MAYSLGLTLYNLGRRGAGEAPPPDLPARPDRAVVWLHAPSADAARPARALARRIVASLGAAVVLTAPVGSPEEPGTMLVPTPADAPSAARAFLDHWRPAIGVLFEGEMRPALIHEASARGVPLVLAEGRAPVLPRGRNGWWPGLMRATLAHIRLVLAVDEAAGRAFRKAGAIPGAVEVAGRMELPSAALPCNEAERAELAALLRTRPVWLAAAVTAEEEGAVVAAHRSALRLAHRLLLVLVPENADRATALARQLEEVEGWNVASRAAEEVPDAEVQVYIADTAEYGLWFRLAPVTFLGGSLAGGGCRIDPLEPAALGSAVVHGPRGGSYGAVIGRLAAAQGAALVGSAADLAEAVSELLAPDRAARSAAAAWAVASEGTQVTERLVEIVRTALDAQVPVAAGPG
jgi:3-deoxy-D-manno-octulosonic-acid transferase